MAQGISCDSPIPNWAGGGENVEKLSEVVSNVCFYGCFVTILWEMSINKYESLGAGLQSMATSFVGLGRYLLESGIDLGEVGTGVFEALIANIEGLVSGAYDVLKTQFESFTDAFWTFAKGEVVRFFEPMMLASIQYMVDELKTELGNRSQLLDEIELKIDEVKTAINNLFGYDWWEDWLAATLWASRHVREADLELQRSYSDVGQGSCDSKHMDNCQEHILAAWKLLASDDDFTAFMTELGDTFEIGAYHPFDSSFKINLYNDFIDDLKIVGEKMFELKDMYTCLNRTSGRAHIHQMLIIAATKVVDRLASGDSGHGIFIDVLLEDSAMRQIHDKLVQIYDQMQDVIENEKKTAAPIYGMQWRNELGGILTLFAGFGFLPDPLGLDFGTLVTAGSNALTYLVYPHVPGDGVKSLSEYDFSEGPVGRRLQEFILSAGNLSDILTNHSQWEQKITQIKTSIKNMKQSDNRAKALCETFVGFDNERFDYIVDLVDRAGWTAAHKYLTSGKIEDFLQLSISSLSMTSIAVQCLSQTISTMIPDSGIQTKLNALLAQGMAEDRVATRSSVVLPSFQFQAFNTIQERLSALEVEMQDILGLQQVVC